MEPITLILLGAGGYYVWKKNQNPEWSPLAWATSTPLDKHAALERVKVASVPTPAPTAALDPGMSTDQVKQVNHALTTETDHEKIKAHADALGSLGHASSAAALDAKAKAVGEARAHGACEAEIHGKQIEAQAPAAVGWGMPGYPFGGNPAYGHAYHPEPGYPWNEAAVGWGMPGYPFGGNPSYGHAYHPEPGYPWNEAGDSEYLTGIQSGPAIVGIQSGPAIVGIQSGPAIVGWDLFAHGVPAGGGGRPGWGPQQRPPQQRPQQQRSQRLQHHGDGRHGRFLPQQSWGHPHHPHHQQWEQWRHHRRHYRPEEEFIEQPLPEPEPEPEMYEEEVVVPEEVHVEHHHHHEHEPAPQVPVSVTPGIITNGGFPPIEWPEEFVGVAQYGGGGLVAEFPGVPQQAQPYGAPVGQYGQYGQPYAQPPQYGADLFQEYADAIEPQLEAQYYQPPQQYYYQRRHHHPYRRFRRW